MVAKTSSKEHLSWLEDQITDRWRVDIPDAAAMLEEYLYVALEAIKEGTPQPRITAAGALEFYDNFTTKKNRHRR